MTQSGLRIKPKVARWAVPLLEPCRYKGAKGGRTGGKSHQLCELAAEKMCSRPDYKIAGIREIQKSIKHSLKTLLEKKIHELGGAYLFDFQATEIRRIGGDGVAYFLGMQDHTADSVKGLEDFDLGLVDEANGLTANSLKKLRPTFRKQGSEIHFAWNPESEDDPIDVFFAENEGDPDFRLVHVNITDNPFASETALSEYRREKAIADVARERVAQARRENREPDDKDMAVLDVFEHVWHGAYNKRSQSIVFHNWRKALIRPPEGIIWRYGIDWGFGVDPLAAVKFCYIPQPKDVTDILYFERALSQAGVRIEDTPEFLMGLSNIENWPSRADNARPEMIDYCRRNGLPKMRKALKGPGSVEDGTAFLQSVDLVLHPTACAPLEAELKAHKYKTVKRTGQILPVVEDSNNHCLDATRYGSEGLHRKGKLIDPRKVVATPRPGRDYGFYEDEDEGGTWKTM